MYVFAFTYTYKDINYIASGGELTPIEIRKGNNRCCFSLLLQKWLIKFFLREFTHSLLQRTLKTNNEQ